MRTIHQIRLNQSPQQWDARAAVRSKTRKDKSAQTVINLVDNHREYETYSYLYDKDQDLLKGEKTALLKYMRKEVV